MTTTLTDLTAGVYRDLADEDKAVFSTAQIEDFIRGGIADLNRASPAEVAYDIPLVTDPDTGVPTQFAYVIPVTQHYLIEIVDIASGWARSVTEPVDGWIGSGGINLKPSPDGGVITFPEWWLAQFPAATHLIRVHGYGSRVMPDPTDPDTDMPLSVEEEFSVRTFAKSAGFDTLSHDRSLFAQWQGQTNNSDVSPTQMMQMAANAKSESDRHRGLIRTVRRYW